MYNQKRVLDQNLTKAVKQINLPRDAVINNIICRCHLQFDNAGAADATINYEQMLSCIEEINVKSDGKDVHYSVSGLDVRMMNYYDSGGIGKALEDTETVPADGSKAVDVLLQLNGGSILAITKNSLAMGWRYKTDTGVTNVTLNEDNSYIEVAVDETIYEDEEEFIAAFGKELELAAEPKVVTMETSVNVQDYKNVLDLPTDTLLLRAFIVARDANVARSDTVIDQIGITATAPKRTELYKLSWSQLQLLDEQDYALARGKISGVSVIDYDDEITQDGLGLKGWRWNKGDVVLGAKIAASGTVRYISHEHIVNPDVIDAMEEFEEFE